MGTPLSSQPSWGSLFSFSPSASTPVTPPDLEQQQQRVQHASPIIERFRHGYPRYSALLSSADCFLVLRRFKRLRARVLLRKQDKLTTLEQKLDEIDDDEKMPMFLGTCRHDKNAERERVLAEIEEHLLDYGELEPSATNATHTDTRFADKFVETTNKTLAYDDARPRDISSLQNWLHGNGCIIKGERAYLDHHRDLFSVVPAVDNAMVNFESWVEDLLISMSWYREVSLYFHSPAPAIRGEGISD